jgi:hypothetical protein
VLLWIKASYSSSMAQRQDGSMWAAQTEVGTGESSDDEVADSVSFFSQQSKALLRPCGHRMSVDRRCHQYGLHRWRLLKSRRCRWRPCSPRVTRVVLRHRSHERHERSHGCQGHAWHGWNRRCRVGHGRSR